MKKQNRIAFLNIASTVLLRGISLITSPLFSRLLGTNGYGILSTYSVWTNVISTVCTLQTQGTIVNARVEYDESAQKGYQSSVLTLSMLVYACFCAVILLFLKPISSLLELDALLIVLMLVQAFGAFAVSFLNNKFTYEFKAGRNLLLSVGSTLLTLGVSVVIVSLMPQQSRYVGRIWGLAGTYGLYGLAASIYILRSGRTFYKKEYWRFCLTLAVPVVFYTLSDLLLGHSDVVMLRSMLGNDEAGIYSMAYNLANVLFTIFTALNNSWTPFFFDDMKQGNRERVRSQAKNFLEVFTVLSVGFILLAPEVFHLYAREDYWDGTQLITIFAASFFLNFLCTFPVNFEYYRKKTRMVAFATVSSALLNIGLNYVLIQSMGMAGAAVATLLSHVFQYTFHVLYSQHIGGGNYPFGLRLWGGYALSFAAVALLVWFTPSLRLLRWALGAAIGLWELWQLRKRRTLF